jgi:hypothetical protein
MLKTFMWIGFSLLGAVMLLVAYAATFPNTFRVERSLSIKINYGQSSSGKSGSYQWDSNGRAGKGDVSWSLSGAYPLINRVFGIVFKLDKMVGGEFEKGLSDLKRLAEK